MKWLIGKLPTHPFGGSETTALNSAAPGGSFLGVAPDHRPERPSWAKMTVVPGLGAVSLLAGLFGSGGGGGGGDNDSGWLRPLLGVGALRAAYYGSTGGDMARFAVLTANVRRAARNLPPALGRPFGLSSPATF